MQRSKKFVAAGLSILFAAGWLSAFGADEAADPSPPLSFKGKIVLFVVLDRANALQARSHSELLKEPVVRKMGDRYFVVGAAVSPAESDANWRTDAEVGIAWDTVQIFYAYDANKADAILKRMSDREE